MCILVGLSSEHRQHCRKRVGCESADYACHLSLVGSSGVLHRRSRTKEMYKCFLLVIIACSLCEMTRMQEMGVKNLTSATTVIPTTTVSKTVHIISFTVVEIVLRVIIVIFLVDIVVGINWL